MQERSLTSWSWCWGRTTSWPPQGSSRRGESTWWVARRRVATKKASKASGGDKETEFLGEPFNADEARTKWPQHYQSGPAKRPDEEEDVKARCQHRSAKVDEVAYSLGGDVYVMAGENVADYIG